MMKSVRSMNRSLPYDRLNRFGIAVVGKLGACAIIACSLCSVGFAHDGKPHTPRDLATTWALEPFVILSLALAGLIYVSGVHRLWRESASGQGIRKWEAWCFATGWLVLFIALLSPLHPLGSVLFSAHMTQHELLMLIAAPLIVLGRPMIAFVWCMPFESRKRAGRISKIDWIQRFWRTVTNPFVAWAIHALALWIWHAPYLFEATLHSEIVHSLQHSSFLFSALLFWWALIHGRQGMRGYGAAVLYMFATSIHSGVLGALITFSSSIWYPGYADTTSSWGVTALEDQQLGGLIMWIPAGVVYIVGGLALFAGWMRESERRVARRENIAVGQARSR